MLWCIHRLRGGQPVAASGDNAHNLALAEQNLPGQDLVSGCPACWLYTRKTAEKLHEFGDLMAEANEALKEAWLNFKGTAKARHIVEVLVEGVGFVVMKQPVVKPLEGIKIADYVGCQINRPFSISGESFENPQYFDKMIETVGAKPARGYPRK